MLPCRRLPALSPRPRISLVPSLSRKAYTDQLPRPSIPLVYAASRLRLHPLYQYRSHLQLRKTICIVSVKRGLRLV
jgi:hypothetical protein